MSWARQTQPILSLLPICAPMVLQPPSSGAATNGRKEAAAGKEQALRQSQAVPAQLSRYMVRIRLGKRMGFRLKVRKDGLVLNLCRQTSDIRPSLTFFPFFYKAFNTVYFSPCYACLNCVTPVKPVRSKFFKACTTYITFS